MTEERFQELISRTSKADALITDIVQLKEATEKIEGCILRRDGIDILPIDLRFEVLHTGLSVCITKREQQLEQLVGGGFMEDLFRKALKETTDVGPS